MSELASSQLQDTRTVNLSQCLLYCVNVIPAKKPSLEEINQFIGIELLISSFLLI